MIRGQQGYKIWLELAIRTPGCPLKGITSNCMPIWKININAFYAECGVISCVSLNAIVRISLKLCIFVLVIMYLIEWNIKKRITFLYFPKNKYRTNNNFVRQQLLYWSGNHSLRYRYPCERTNPNLLCNTGYSIKLLNNLLNHWLIIRVHNLVWAEYALQHILGTHVGLRPHWLRTFGLSKYVLSLLPNLSRVPDGLNF